MYAEKLHAKKLDAWLGLEQVAGKRLVHDICKILFKLIMIRSARIDTNPST